MQYKVAMLLPLHNTPPLWPYDYPVKYGFYPELSLQLPTPYNSLLPTFTTHNSQLGPYSTTCLAQYLQITPTTTGLALPDPMVMCPPTKYASTSCFLLFLI